MYEFSYTVIFIFIFKFQFATCSNDVSPSSLVPNPCKNVCSHLCLLRPGGYTCACPEGSSPVDFDSSECNAGTQQLRCVRCPMPPVVLHLKLHSDVHSPTRAWLLLCVFSVVTVTICSVVFDSVYAWLLLPQPLRHLLQCPLHVDA